VEHREALASLPRIDGLVAAAPELVRRYGRAATTSALRSAVDQARTDVLAGGAAPTTPALIANAAEQLATTRPGPPARVINAAGVIIHTNLGRAPLSEAARDAVEAAAGYCDVEYDTVSGRRGARAGGLEPLLTSLTGAEAGIAVNNGAAALVLALAALAGGRQVVVSRGELVEIGGSFRLPDVMASAGVRLLEVGTTNRTRVQDYAAGDDVGLLLKVHPSNYRMSGFVEAPGVAQLAELAGKRGVPLLHDIGSGLLAPARAEPLRDEPDATTSIAQGADLVVFSGDKLLGGPQAGLLVGRADLVRRCANHPLARALRLDKLRLAALVVTLEQHARGDTGSIPVWAALTADRQALGARTDALAAAVGATVVDSLTMLGGGAAPQQGLETPVARVATAHPEELAAALRRGQPPVIVRITDGAVLVDLRTVSPEEDAVIVARLREHGP
jgi:L-seryl-tRNA(Ser) seleniumtransferase